MGTAKYTQASIKEAMLINREKEKEKKQKKRCADNQYPQHAGQC